MAELLETIEVKTGLHPDAAVIWLHGLGADGNDFVPIVDELKLPAGLRIRFVFPHAPMMPVTINGGYVMRAWYDIQFDGVERRPDSEGIRASQTEIEKLIAREKSRGIAADRIVLAGFSQGGAITLQTGLRHGERLAGLMVLSSYLPMPERLRAEAASANADVPIFYAHGRFDPMIEISRAERSVAQLTEHGYAVEWHEYPMEHSVCLEEIQAISAWLSKVIPPTHG
jgi:phospholipase/carboxylesterase